MNTRDTPSAAAEIRQAIVDITPAMVAAAPIGLLYGALATAEGMSVVDVLLTSALVFAGGAQLAAVQIWSYPVPIAALLVSTLLINARYILMSASLAPKVAHLPLLGRILGFHVLADENWAMSERRAGGGRISAPYFFGMGAVFWVNWMSFSFLGALTGPLIGDPTRFGADFAFTAMFIALTAGFAKSRTSVMVIVAAALAAAGTHLTVGAPWHVLAGALTGITVAAILDGGEAAR
ncbi:AzlC family ABC transporter permease [Pinisolibacter sp.]|uniref:AzlC family ABC transporter permease n=1 Tax=Pinisolibacter sp. TaxID=2172024 RepID=UPI002FDEAE16